MGSIISSNRHFTPWDGYDVGKEPSEKDQDNIINMLIDVLTDKELNFSRKMNQCSAITVEAASYIVYHMIRASDL